MSPALRVALDRRIAEEGMTPLGEPGERPAWVSYIEGVPRAWTLDEAGQVRAWPFLDEVEWRGVVAARCEWQHGQRIDIEGLGDDDGDYC